MDPSSVQTNVDPVYRKLHRVFFAVCILLAPLTLSMWFGLCPTGAGDAACPDQGRSLAVFAAFHGMSPQMMQIFLFLGLLIPFLYPLSYIGLGLLAMKRSPWLATLGMACGVAGGIVWGAIAGHMAVMDSMAEMGANPLFVAIEHHFYTSWTTLAFAAIWIFGHLLGYVLLGIALARARAVPRWAAVLMGASAPLMGPIAYATNLGQLQILGFMLVFIASIPAARSMLRVRDEQTLALMPTRQIIAREEAR